MSKQLEIFEGEGYLQGYGPKDKEAREQHEKFFAELERARQEPQQVKNEPPQRGIGQGVVFPCRTGNEQAQRVYSLLSDGCRHSVIDISRRLGIGDPRSVIRDLRNAGVQVCDVWERAQNGNRYKSYWIRRL